MSFEELTEFSANTFQVIDGLFVASTSGSFPSRSDDDTTILRQVDMLVAAFDSTFWLVSAPDNVLARVEQTFNRVGPGTAPLSAWGRG